MPTTASSPFQRYDTLAQLILFLASSVGLFLATATWPDTPDGWIHLHRVRALSEALSAGVLLPRWFPDFAFGYGHPVLNFYAPLSYYPAAILLVGGVDALTATRLALAFFYGASAVVMFRLARLWVDLPAALIAVVLFLLFPYRLYDLFVRGALPEFSAFLWLPLLAYASALLVARTEGAWRRRAPFLALTALGWAGLIAAHNLTAFMATLAALVIWLTLCVWALASDKLRPFLRASLHLLFAFVIGVLLSAWYSAPALLEARWVGIGAEGALGYQAHFAAWESLFSWTAPFLYPAAAEPTVALPGYGLFVAVAGIALLFAPSQRGRLPVVLACLSVLFGSVWLTTASSAWLWQVFEPLLGRLQFPWRWQMLVVLPAALLSALLYDAATRRIVVGWALAGALGVSALMGVYALAGLTLQPAIVAGADITDEQMWALDARFGQVGATWTGEFLPTWVTEERWAIGREPPHAPPIATQPLVATGIRLVEAGYLDATYYVEQAEPSSLSFHRFFYPAWQVRADGVPAPTAAVGALGLLRATMPAGSYELRVQWGSTPAVWIGRVCGALGWLIVLWLLWWHGRRRWLVLLWLLMGVTALTGASGVTAQRMPAQPITADFGPVELAGVVAPAAHPGEIAQVDLHWLVKQPSGDLTAFVHLLDADGQIVAQHDGPLATGYTPASRWLAGELLVGRHLLSLPADLAPGQYGLRIGLYPPDAADQPLTPVGGDAPFVLGGILEVQP